MSESESAQALAEPEPEPESEAGSEARSESEAVAPRPEPGQQPSAAATHPPQGWALPDAAPQFAKSSATVTPPAAAATVVTQPLATATQPVQAVTQPMHTVPQPAAPMPQPAAPLPPGGYVAPPGPNEPLPAPGQLYPAQQYPGMLPTAAFAPDAAAPAARKFPRKKVLLFSGAGVLALALVAAGIVALIPGRTGNSAVSVVHCKPASLTSCLIKPPAGAEQLTSTDAWDKHAAGTADRYSANVVTNAPGVVADTSSLLDTDGVRTVAHADWNAVDGNNVDLVLLSFASQKGARAWNSTRAAEIAAAYRGQSVTIPGDTTGKAYAATKADSHGNVNAGYSVVVGTIVLDVAYSSPKTFSAKDLQTWAGTELASLHTAPAAPADHADTGAGMQKVACGSGLTSCLAPMPSGAEHWTSPNSNDWVSASTLTPKQFVTLEWNADSRSGVLSNFTQDGVTGIAHQDWVIDGANEQADLYLIQTITAAGASQLGGSNFGVPNWQGGLSAVAFNIPGEPDADAWYTNKPDSGGFINFYFTQDIGNVIVHGWLFFYGSFDSGTAGRWAKAQLDRVKGTVTDQPMGLFPLAAPSLPAPKQGSCPSSGDCLMPAPAGTSDTTKSSYAVEPALNAAAYTDQYETVLSSDLTTWLGSDGFASAEHRSWTAGNGATADAVLLKFGSPAQARAAAQLEYGVNGMSSRSCTDAAVPDSLCLAEPVTASDPLQKEIVRVLAWKGDYEVAVTVTVSNSADVADAYAWAQQQLDLLPAG